MRDVSAWTLGSLRKDTEAEKDFAAGHGDAEDDENDNDPRDATHLLVGDAVAEDLGEVEEDATAFVEHLDPGLDLEVFPHGEVERVQGGFGFPEEVWDVEHVARWNGGDRHGLVYFAAAAGKGGQWDTYKD